MFCGWHNLQHIFIIVNIYHICIKSTAKTYKGVKSAKVALKSWEKLVKKGVHLLVYHLETLVSCHTFYSRRNFNPGLILQDFKVCLQSIFNPALVKKNLHLGSKLMCDTNIFNIFFLEIENSIPGQNCMCEGVLSKEASFFPIMEAISTRFENRTCTMQQNIYERIYTSLKKIEFILK